jgi:hypothetical protein
MASRIGLAVIAVAASSSVGIADPALTLDHTFVTNGGVTTTLVDGNTLYLGGSFTYVGQRSGGFALVSADTGAWNKSLPQTAGGAIFTIIPDGGGGYFVGGDLRAADSMRLRGLAHLTAAGAWDPKFAPSFDGYVYAMAHDATTLYVGGDFRHVNGVARANFAAFDLATGQLTSLSRDTSGQIDSMSLDGSMLFIGGSFGSIDGQARANVARLDVPSATVAAWNPTANGEVKAVFATGSTVYVAGRFTKLGSQTRNHVGAIDAGTAAIRGFNPNTAGEVDVIARQNGALYLGGHLGTVGGQPRSDVAAVDSSTGAVLAFDAQVHTQFGGIQALLATPSAVYIGGYGLDSIGGQPHENAGAVDPTTGVALSWNPFPSGRVTALAVHPNGILVGGPFTSVNGQPRSNLAAIDLTTGRATAWKPTTTVDPSLNTSVQAIVKQGSAIYIGGFFSTINGQPRVNLGAVDATTGALLPFRADTTPDPRNGNGTVFTLASMSSALYVGGEFISISGAARNYLAAVDLSTGAAQAWNPNPNNVVYTLLPLGSRIYAGGQFSTINGVSNLRMSVLDATTAAPGPDYNVQGAVISLAYDGTNVIVGGQYSQIAGVTRSSLAAIVPGTTTVTSWTPALPAGSFIHVIAVAPTSIYVGSVVSATVVVDRSTGALQHPSTALPEASSITILPSKLVLGGDFGSINTLAQSGIAVYSGTP